MDACIHPCMYVCMHGYPPIQYLLYTTPMHVPYTIYHVSYTTFISHHVTPCHALLPLTPTSTVYHTFMSHHITSCHVMSCHVTSCTLTTSHIYHVPYTMYHLFSCHLPFLTYLYCALLLCTPNAPQLYLSHPMHASPNCASIRPWVLPIPLSCLESNRHGMVQCGMAWCGIAWNGLLPSLLPSRASVSIKHPFFLVHHVHVCMYMHVSLV
jgi:hypothetical protein